MVLSRNGNCIIQINCFILFRKLSPLQCTIFNSSYFSKNKSIVFRKDYGKSNLMLCELNAFYFTKLPFIGFTSYEIKQGVVFWGIPVTTKASTTYLKKPSPHRERRYQIYAIINFDPFTHSNCLLLGNFLPGYNHNQTTGNW